MLLQSSEYLRLYVNKHNIFDNLKSFWKQSKSSNIRIIGLHFDMVMILGPLLAIINFIKKLYPYTIISNLATITK